MFWIVLVALVFAGWCCFKAGWMLGRESVLVERRIGDVLGQSARDEAVLRVADEAHQDLQ